ncbi:MAG: hypothetical protein AB7F86_09665 [Bdellovibrionales bacterium]
MAVLIAAVFSLAMHYFVIGRIKNPFIFWLLASAFAVLCMSIGMMVDFAIKQAANATYTMSPIIEDSLLKPLLSGGLSVVVSAVFRFHPSLRSFSQSTLKIWHFLVSLSIFFGIVLGVMYFGTPKSKAVAPKNDSTRDEKRFLISTNCITQVTKLDQQSAKLELLFLAKKLEIAKITNRMQINERFVIENYQAIKEDMRKKRESEEAEYQTLVAGLTGKSETSAEIEKKEWLDDLEYEALEKSPEEIPEALTFEPGDVKSLVGLFRKETQLCLLDRCSRVSLDQLLKILRTCCPECRDKVAI